MSLFNPQDIRHQLDSLKKQELAQFSQMDVCELISSRSRYYDQLLIQLWQDFQLADYSDLALIAVGGYGRQEMFPLSDLDILILTVEPMSDEVSQKVTALIQFLWDCRFEVGQSVRSLAQCLDEGKKDISIATNLLESRYLAGNKTLFMQLENAVHHPDFWSKADFFYAKMQEKNERYQRYHNTSYNLEPDIKYSPGGLRDLHLLYWIALRHLKAHTLEDILQVEFIYPAEYAILRKSQNFLFRTRFALHLILKRYDNRLLFDRQLTVSEMLGFTGEGNQGVESMMKQFFQALQAISLLSYILMQHYKEHFLLPSNTQSVVAIDNHFIIQGKAIRLAEGKDFVEQPERILDLFWHLTQYQDCNIHSSTLRQLALSIGQLTGKLSDLPLAREKFILLLSQPQAIRRAFRPMHRYGVLNAYLPAWAGIEGLMQFDLFHVYTVDEHTLCVLEKLESFLDVGNLPTHPLCCEIFPQTNRTLLYLAALFHDIAKGRGGTHEILGAEDMENFAQQHGFTVQDTSLMVWLVQHHLLMSITAQRRDIHDSEVVRAFADKIQDQTHLDALLCLTVADICATNMSLWNSWKRSLLATLYLFTTEQLKQGTTCSLSSQQKVQEHRGQALSLLEHLPVEKITAFWQRLPDEYFLRNTAKQIAWESELLCENQNDFVVKISNRFAMGGTEVFIYCPDKHNLFNQIVSTIDAKNLSIHNAQIITTHDGFALDSFIVTELDGRLAKFDRRRALEAALIDVLSGKKEIRYHHKNKPKLQHFYVPTEIHFINENKTTHTELEISTLDKVGLLAEISQIFTELKLNLLNAKITTNGEKVEDFFILTNENNQALSLIEKRNLREWLYAI